MRTIPSSNASPRPGQAYGAKNKIFLDNDEDSIEICCCFPKVASLAKFGIGIWETVWYDYIDQLIDHFGGSLHYASTFRAILTLQARSIFLPSSFEIPPISSTVRIY